MNPKHEEENGDTAGTRLKDVVQRHGEYETRVKWKRQRKVRQRTQNEGTGHYPRRREPRAGYGGGRGEAQTWKNTRHKGKDRSRESYAQIEEKLRGNAGVKRRRKVRGREKRRRRNVGGETWRRWPCGRRGGSCYAETERGTTKNDIRKSRL